MSGPAPFRPLPLLTPRSEPYWKSGADGRLRLLRCRACLRFHHPPGPRCPHCLGADLGWEPVSGSGTIYSCTLNHQRWYPGWDTPYAIAIVRLDEQDDLRLTTNIVGCPPEAVRIGQRVQVRFEPREDVWLPLFELVAEVRS